MTLAMDTSKPDMTTSISNKYKPVFEVAGITAFNTDAFSTWRSAFRECCKLASSSIPRQNNNETNQRLDIWCTVGNGAFGEYAIRGANEGKKYGIKHMNDITALKKINDFEWLKEIFEQ
jgi:hypothetical protein